MPVVDKLPALLREDLESAFEDDLDNIFDITNLQHSLCLQKRDTEIELKRVLQLSFLIFFLDCQSWHLPFSSRLFDQCAIAFSD